MPYLRYKTKDTAARVDVWRIGWLPSERYQKELYLLSAYGPQNALRGLASVLQTELRADLVFHDDEGNRTDLRRSEQKYKVAGKHKLFGQLWQFLYLADDPCLLLNSSDTALWKRLMDEPYTTPLLRGWLPWIRRELEARQLLRTLDGCNETGLVLTASTDELDEIVSGAVRDGDLCISKNGE